MKKIVLTYLRKAHMGGSVYKAEDGTLFVDNSNYHDLRDYKEHMELAPCSGDYDEAWDLCSNMKKYKDVEFEVEEREILPTKDEQFNYMMLSRLQMDCDYYLGYGGRNAEHALWSHDEKKQIAKMKDIYNQFADDRKPEWLTYEQILEYEQLMTNQSPNK